MTTPTPTPTPAPAPTPRDPIGDAVRKGVRRLSGLSTAGAVGVALAVAVVIACGVAGMVKLASLAGSAKAADVSLTSCDGPDVLGGVQSEVTVTNSSSSTRSYRVTVEFLDDTRARLGNTTELVSNVRPGATVREVAATWIGSTRHSVARCQIKSVS